MADEVGANDFLAVGADSRFARALRRFARRGQAERVLLSDAVVKVNKRGVRQRRLLVVTDCAVYNVAPDGDGSRAGAVRRRIDFADLGAVTVAFRGSDFVLHVPHEYDYHLMSARKAIVLEVLKRCYERACGVELLVHTHAAGAPIAHVVETKLVKKALAKVRAAGALNQYSFITHTGFCRARGAPAGGAGVARGVPAGGARGGRRRRLRCRQPKP